MSVKKNITHAVDHAQAIAAVPVSAVWSELETDQTGLTEAVAAKRLARDGYNVIAAKKETGIILEFLLHFNNPLVIVLLLAASISAFLGGVKNLIVITFIVLASVTLEFIEEHSANNAAKKLRESVSLTATVLRNDKEHEIDTAKLCVGDVICLNAGDLIPADARIVAADDFFVNDAALTGEAFPHEKQAEPSTTDDEHNLNNLIWLGTNVVSGTARAVVFQTGSNTRFGSIAQALTKTEEKSDFERGITSFGYFITKIILILVLFVFLGDALINQNILESLLFAVAIAVGVTPELLPMIMTITMARGSHQMAAKGVIVKKLSAIPNFGSMDILCTDKTGTLSEDRISLVKYTDLLLQTDERVFLYSYLNSYYQTGLESPLNQAVLDHKSIDVTAYTKVEEIPFDFERRMLSIAVSGPDGRTLITEGAPEAVLARCTRYQAGDKEHVLTPQKAKQTLDNYKQLSSDGYRVLAVAQKNNLPVQAQYTTATEAKLTLIGFVAFFDPPKRGIAKTLTELRENGLEIKIITGDNELVTEKICHDIGLEIKGVLLGNEIAALTDDALAQRAERTTIFARFAPGEKNRIISVLRARGHVVGYLGDGINDAPSLKAADIGISVNNAVDVAKEAADIILTHKNLKPLIDGVREGRRVFGNTMKYLMMGLSSNFGNMFSVLFAVFYLPFLPMLPLQILLNNFVYDLSQTTIPTDNVDPEWLMQPKKWNMNFIKHFMLIFGPLSSAFDILTFIIMFALFHLPASAFQTGWFLESIATQTLVIHIIRTRHLPVLRSNASRWLLVSTIGAVTLAWLIPYTPAGPVFGFTRLPLTVLALIAAIVFGYLLTVEVAKRAFYRRNGF